MPAGKRVGGMDFGYNSPFAALWGVLDQNDVLWLIGEHFCRAQPLSHHAGIIPKNVTWYCDPAGANERAELRRADFTILQGTNAIRPGIAAVAARIQSGRLRVLAGQCPNLVLESGMYRYDPRLPGAESPIDAYNHAMDALRYLIYGLDALRLVRPRRAAAAEKQSVSETSAALAPPDSEPKPWLRPDNEALWADLY